MVTLASNSMSINLTTRKHKKWCRGAHSPHLWWGVFALCDSYVNPRLPKGGGYHPRPLRFIFRPAKTLNFTIKWVQLIVGSSFPVILAQKIYYPTLG